MKNLLVIMFLSLLSMTVQAKPESAEMEKVVKDEMINAFYDAWDSGSREKYENIISKKLIDHDRNPMSKHSDFDGMWQLLQSLQGLEMEHNIEQTHHLEGNKVLVRWLASAKHTGDFFGMPATQKTAYYVGHDILQLHPSGQITEIWHVEQIFQLMQQLK